jgi:NAD(P)-dependent dehydrogenase (short-subunit alcohol dehydrogenase family)
MRVLVTGASTGIGRATALELARRGAAVLAGVRDPAAAPEGCTALELDVTSPDDVAAAGEEATRGGLDALVNNAGIAVVGPLEYLPLDALRRQLEVNTVAQLAVTQACLPALRASRGRIVNLSSIAGRMALPLYGPYAASKYALEALSDSLRQELRGTGVDVVLVEPGAIDTLIWERGTRAGDALWEALPAVARERYGPLQQTIRRLAEHAGRDGEPPEVVARTIADVLAARRPRTRYVIGRDARLQAALQRVMAGRAMDALVRAALNRRT